MSKQIDERVVEMQFDNKQFEKNIAQSTKSLEELKNSLKMENATKGFTELEKAAKKVDFSALSKNVENISNKFTLAGRIAMAYMDRIANKIVNTATRIGSALLIDPVRTGFAEYELKMDSVKTIMNATGESIETVTKYLEELNKYADDTIYSFSDMTSNIGKFTNNGVKLDDAVAAIKGISNAAALAGAGTAQASSAMYNLSQSLSSFLNTRDWYSIENAQMATVGFKQALIDTGVELGTLKKEADGVYRTVKGNHEVTTKNFRDTLQYQWGTSEVIIETLKKYSDTSTELGQKAQEAATQVRTLSKMWDALREAAQSGWGQTWEIVFGNLEEATTLFTGMSNAISEVLNKQSETRNEILKIWKTLGGRNSLINAGASIFSTVRSVFAEIKRGLFDTTPQQVAIALDNISEKIETFATNLKKWIWSPNKYDGDWPVLASVRKGAEGLKSILGIVWDLVSGLWNGIKTLFPSLGDILKNVLANYGKMGEWFTNLRASIRKGQIFSKFTQSLVGIVKPLIDYIPKLWEKLKSAFVSLGGIFSKFNIGDKIKTVFTSFTNFLPKAGDAIWSFCEKVVAFFKESQIFSKIGGIFESIWSGIASMLTVFSTAINKIGKLGVGEWLADTFTNISNAIGKCAKSAWRAIKEFFTGIDYGYIWTTVSNWFSRAWDAVSDFFTGIDYAGIWNRISLFFKESWADVTGFFGGIDYRAAWGAVSAWFKATWNAVQGFFTSIDYAGIWGKISSAFSVGWSAVEGFFGNIDYAAVWRAVSDWFTTAWSAVKSFFGKIDYAGIWAKALSVFSSGWNSVKKIFSFIGEIFGKIDYAGIWTKALSVFSSGWNSVKKIFSSIGETLFGADTWGKFANSKGVTWIKNAFVSVGSAIKDAVAWLKSIFASIDLSGIKDWFTDLFLTSEDSLSETTGIDKSLTETAEKTETIFTKIGNIFKRSWNALARVPSWFSPSKLIAYGVIFVVGKLVLAVINLVQGAGNALSALGKQSSFVEKCEAVSKFILTLAGVLAAMSLLNEFMGPQMLMAAGELVGVISVISIVSLVVQAIGRKLGGGVLNSILQIGSGLVGIFAAISLFSTMRWDTLVNGLKNCLVVLGAFTAVLAVVQLIFGLISRISGVSFGTTGGKEMKAVATAFLEIAAALVLMIIPIAAFGALPEDTYRQGIKAVAIVMAGLAAIALIAGKCNFKFQNGAAILATVLSLVVVLPAIALLGLFSDDMIMRSSVMLGTLLVFILALSSIVKAINAKDIKGLKSSAFSVLIVAAGTIWAFASALDRVKNVKWTTIATFSAGFAAAVISFALAISMLGKLNGGTALKGIGILASAVLALSLVASIAAVVVGAGIEEFTEYLIPIGQNLATFADSVKDVNKDQVAAAGEALYAIAEFCGKSWIWSLSVEDIKTFTEQATSIGYNLSGFCTSVADVNPGKVENAKRAMEKLADLMKYAASNGTKSDVPKKMTENALSVATNLNSFCSRLSGFVLSKIESAYAGMIKLCAMMKYGADHGTKSDTPKTMTENALSVASNLNSFCTRIGKNFKIGKVVVACAGIALLSTTFAGVAEASTSTITDFSSNLTSIGGGLSQFMSGIADYDDAGKKKIDNASELMGKIKQLATDLKETGDIADNLNDMSAATTNLGAALSLYYKMVNGAVPTDGSGVATLSPEEVGKGLGSMIAAVAAELPDDNAIKQIASYAGGEGTGGKLTDFSLGLEAIATALKTYGTNCEGLDLDKVMLGNSVLDQVSQIPGKLSGDNNLLSFLTNNSTSLSTFATDLNSIGTGLGNFATATKDMTSGSVSGAGEALTLLVGLQNKLDSSASIWSFFKSESSLGSLATDLPTLGDSLADFYNATWFISSKLAAGGLEMLANLCDTSINYSNIGQLATALGGFAGGVTGAQTLSEFGNQLGAIGGGLGDFYTATKDITGLGEGEKFGSVQLLEQLIDLATKQGNTGNVSNAIGGLMGVILGAEDLSTFTGKFNEIGKAIGTFYKDVSLIRFEKATEAVGFLALMASLENNFPTIGNNNIESFAGRIANAAASLEIMNTILERFKLNESYSDMVAILREFLGIQTALNDIMSGQNVDMDKLALDSDMTKPDSLSNIITFGQAIEEVASYISTANSELSGENVAGFEQAASGLEHLTNAIYAAQGLSSADGANLVEVVRGFVDNNLSDKQINTDNMVGGWLLWIGKSIAGSVGALSTDIETFMSGVITTFNTYGDNFETSGKNFALGFANGLSSEATLASVISAVNTLAETALTNLNSALDEHSPSKKTQQSGRYFSLGFIEGVQSESYQLIKTVTDMGSTVTGGLEASIVNGAGSATNTLGKLLREDVKSIASDVGTTLGETLVDKASGGILTKYQNVAGTLKDFGETVGASFGDISIGDAANLMETFKEGGVDAATEYLSTMAESSPELKQLAEYLKLYGITSDKVSSTATSLNGVSEAIASSGSSVSRAAVDMGKIISLYDAINKVGSSVDLLGEKVASMQIVMDSGALVGSIETQIDSRLGTMTALRSRGV